mgnify:CR=1 FL=1
MVVQLIFQNIKTEKHWFGVMNLMETVCQIPPNGTTMWAVMATETTKHNFTPKKCPTRKRNFSNRGEKRKMEEQQIHFRKIID